MNNRPNYASLETTEDNRDAPQPGTVGIKHWSTGRTLAFVVTDSYTEAVDVSDDPREKQWREHTVTVCQYTEGEHSGEKFYLWGERWDKVTDLRSPSDVCFSDYTDDQLRRARKHWERLGSCLELATELRDLGIDATDHIRLKDLWREPRTRKIAVPNNLI